MMKKKKSKLISKYKVLFNSIREYKKPSLLTPFFVALEVVFEILIPLVMAEMIDKMTGSSMEPIYRYGLILILMALVSLFSGFAAGKYAATASTGFAKNLRHDLYYKVQDFSFSEIDYFSTSSLVTRLTTDVNNVQNAYQMIIRIAIRTPLMMIFAFVMSFTISSQLAIIFVGVIPLLAIGLILIFRKVIPTFRKILKKYDKLNNTVQENIGGIRVVKSFVREEYEKNKFHKAASDVRDDFTYVEKVIALTNPLMIFSIYVTLLLLSYLGAKTIINSAETALTTGELSTLIMYSTQILMSVMMFSMIFVMITISIESINRISEVLHTNSSLDANINGLKKVVDGSITFKNVCFQYSKQAHKYALEDINLEIKTGETIGIIGGTGSAKSTLVQLIPRLYDATVGEVLVGGRNVKEYNIKNLRDEVAVVLQKNVLFSGTIKENLRWGKKDATDEEMVTACKLACADEFIMQFPEKYDTYIERGGTNLSGGQKQRLCIARALLKKPKIIIFDDSTSAVDTKTDAKIRKAIEEKLPYTTKIIIAQRLSSVENANKIIMMDNGRIFDIGSHDELMRKNDIYRQIYNAQSKGKDGE